MVRSLRSGQRGFEKLADVLRLIELAIAAFRYGFENRLKLTHLKSVPASPLFRLTQSVGQLHCEQTVELVRRRGYRIDCPDEVGDGVSVIGTRETDCCCIGPRVFSSLQPLVKETAHSAALHVAEHRDPDAAHAVSNHLRTQSTHSVGACTGRAGEQAPVLTKRRFLLTASRLPCRRSKLAFVEPCRGPSRLDSWASQQVVRYSVCRAVGLHVVLNPPDKHGRFVRDCRQPASQVAVASLWESTRMLDHKAIHVGDPKARRRVPCGPWLAETNCRSRQGIRFLVRRRRGDWWRSFHPAWRFLDGQDCERVRRRRSDWPRSSPFGRGLGWGSFRLITSLTWPLPKAEEPNSSSSRYMIGLQADVNRFARSMSLNRARVRLAGKTCAAPGCSGTSLRTFCGAKCGLRRK